MQVDRMDLFPVPVIGAEFDNGEELRKTLVQGVFIYHIHCN